MNKKRTLITLYLTGVLSSTLFLANNTIIEKDEKAVTINQIIDKIVEDVDSYFMQVLVESRYETATSVVWVYGCADKT